MKTFYLYSRYIPFGRFDYVTLLLWVIIKKQYNPSTGEWEKPPMSDYAKIHESAHAYQQVCLFVLGLFALVVTAMSGDPAWWVWLFPVALPFALYGLCWFAEWVLPPYKTAYKDVCFEREARAYEKKQTTLFPFSFFRFILPLNKR